MIWAGGRWEDAGLVLDALFHAETVGDEDDLEVGGFVVFEVGEGAFVLLALIGGEVGEIVFDGFDDAVLFFLVGEELCTC